MSTSTDPRPSLAHRLSVYSTVAAATSAAAGQADANDVVWDITDVTVAFIDTGEPRTTYGLLFNMNDGNTAVATTTNNPTAGQFRLDPLAGGFIYAPTAPAAGNFGLIGSIDTSTYTYNGMQYTYDFALALPQFTGKTVSPADSFAYASFFGNFSAYLLLTDGQSAYAGIRFDLPTGVHYGWAQITRIDNATLTLHGFGYNDIPGASSTVSNTLDLPGDTDGDGDIDDADLGTSFAAYTGALPSGEGGNGAFDGDTDVDGDIDDADLGASFAGYTGALGPAVPTNVPEPASLVVLALGAAGLATRRANRDAKPTVTA